MRLLRWVSFSGRLSRGGYWLCYVLPLGAMWAAAIIADLTWMKTIHLPILVPEASAQATMTIAPHRWLLESGGYTNLAFWISLIPGFAGATKRWHDLDQSGWWNILLLVPVLGWFAGMVALCLLPGTKGPNRFGGRPGWGP